MRNTATLPPSPSAAPPRLGVWHRRINPLILDRIMDTDEAGRIRRRVCTGLAGDVLEVGFGTGLNLPHLPGTVQRVFAVDPLERGWELAAERIAASDREVQHAGWDARRVTLGDASVDAVLCTWSLCSIDDPHVAVAEMARVLRPGGELHFVEHGLAGEPRIRRWQRRCDPVWSRLSCGCHLDRDILAILESGGLRVTDLTTYFTESEPRILGWTFEGRASRP